MVLKVRGLGETALGELACRREDPEFWGTLRCFEWVEGEEPENKCSKKK